MGTAMGTGGEDREWNGGTGRGMGKSTNKRQSWNEYKTPQVRRHYDDEKEGEEGEEGEEEEQEERKVLSP